MKAAFTAVVLAAAAGVNAQSTLIPAGVSAECKTFLEAANSNSALQTCIQPLITATEKFSPATNGSPSAADIKASLSTVCKANPACEGTVRTVLADFYAKCGQGAIVQNKDLLNLYDVLYVFTPFKGAVCAVDSKTQEYCVNTISKAAAAAPVANAANHAVKGASDAEAAIEAAGGPEAFFIVSKVAGAVRGVYDYIRRQTVSNFATIVKPNATTYQSTNLPFLFLQPNSPALCSPCSREVFVAYNKWENSIPYPFGLKSSPLLGGQGALWTSLQSTCPAEFAQGIVAEAGASANTLAGAASPRTVLPTFGAVVAGVVAVVLAA